MIEDIKAREKAATHIEEIAARHQKESGEFKGAVGYPSCAGCTANWPCDTAEVLAQLRDREEELEAVEELDFPHNYNAALGGYPHGGCFASCRRCALDRILKGATDD